MIAGLTGRLLLKSPSQVILDVNGVGYEVHIALSTYFSLPNLQDLVTLNISTHLRNDTIQLYGFLTTQEKDTFGLLTGITGIGPKLALSTLSTLPVKDFISAIQANDLDRLSSVPGIGRKSASRIVLELKDKVHRLQPIDTQTGAPLSELSSDPLQQDPSIPHQEQHSTGLNNVAVAAASVPGHHLPNHRFCNQ
jgi:Holliday junction DNA helicase RuvA